jgi:hypothetical protein
MADSWAIFNSLGMHDCWFHGQRLTLSRNSLPVFQSDMQRNSVVWDQVEPQISHVDNDVLAIFDCCDAGSLCSVRKPVRYEYLGACGENAVARGPGEKSFTRALIWALDELISEPFDTLDLLRKVMTAPSFQHGQIPRLAPRGKWRSSIILSPLLPDNERVCENTPVQQPLPHHVDVRFHFDRLDNEAFRKLANEMREMKRVVNAPKVTFIGHEQIGEQAVHWQRHGLWYMVLFTKYGRKWLNIHRTRNRARLDARAKEKGQHVDTDEVGSQSTQPDSTSLQDRPGSKWSGRKRERSEPANPARRRKSARIALLSPTPTDGSQGRRSVSDRSSASIEE